MILGWSYYLCIFHRYGNQSSRSIGNISQIQEFSTVAMLIFFLLHHKREQRLVRLSGEWTPAWPLVGLQTNRTTTEISIKLPKKPNLCCCCWVLVTGLYVLPQRHLHSLAHCGTGVKECRSTGEWAEGHKLHRHSGILLRHWGKKMRW